MLREDGCPNVVSIIVRTAVVSMAALLIPSGQPYASAVTPPTGFQAVAYSPTLVNPVAMAFASDGRCFVAEQRGVVKVVKNGVKLATFIDLRDEVCNTGDRGILGIALDPDFNTNHYVYLMYAVDPVFGAPNEPADDPVFCRVTRYKGTAASDGNLAGLTTRKVLLGLGPSTGFVTCGSSHCVGALRFAPDKSLLVSCGDGARYDVADGGGLTPDCDSYLPNGQDIGAFRSQSLDSLDGKILRIKRTTGEGYSTNPYYDGDLASIRSRIWVSGLRNPFRFAVKPGAPEGTVPTLYIGDVGWNSFEELNVAHGGENFGWPCAEGGGPPPTYPTMTPANSGCDTLESADNPGPVTYPLVYWHHSNPNQSEPNGPTGQCSIGGVFYTKTKYPMPYRGYFFADYVQGWIKVLQVDDFDNYVDEVTFAGDADGPVDFAVHPPSGDVCYISLLDNKVYRFKYTAGNLMAAPAPAPGSGGAPEPPADDDVVTASSFCAADIFPPESGDGVVDLKDLLFMLNQVGEPTVNADLAPGDDGDGQVDADDVLALIAAWGPCK